MHSVVQVHGGVGRQGLVGPLPTLVSAPQVQAAMWAGL